MKKFRTILFASAGLLVPATSLHAQDDTAPRNASADQAGELADSGADASSVNSAPSNDAIVVTGVARGTNRLDTSISVTSIGEEQIVQSAPRSAAEILRNVPGIRAESSGGEGNANINVRGLPVSTGGAKFLQLQEDGLPILEFGDIIFGNADIFLRLDSNVARVESVRGGSASIFASNAPGGIVNFISKDGSTEGGSFQLTSGIDYRSYRSDFDYGGSLDANTRFHLGGFYRVGEGPRHAGYDGNHGGQIKANVTREFDGGYVKFNFKYLDDRAIAYLPSPVRVTGSNDNPDYQGLANLSPNGDTIHSKYFKLVPTLGQDNRLQIDDVGDGMHPKVIAGGMETSFDLADGLNLTNRFRYSDISGGFISPFPAGADAAQAVADSVGSPGSQLFYATGPNRGQAVADPAALNGNGVLIPIVMFNVDIDSLDNLTNDVRLTKTLGFGGTALDLTAGFYFSKQDIATTWNWSSYILGANGNNAVLYDVRNAAGVPQTTGGLVAYGASFFGGCCRRQYDLEYTTKAPFVTARFEAGPLTIDGGVRFDFGDVSGRVIPDGGVAGFDVNGDGTISVPESKATPLVTAGQQTIGYNYDYVSYSVGATYRLIEDASVFARYSRGARANADRLIFGPAITADGGVANEDAVVDVVKQAEGGVKFNNGPYQLYLTGFYSEAEETNFDFGLGFFNNTYRAYGAEAEGSARFGIFQLTASGTYTDAEIRSSSLSPQFVGNRPRRQAKFLYQVTPQVTTDRFSVGANVVGTTDSFTQDSNQLKLPGYTQVNAFRLDPSARQFRTDRQCE